MTVSVTMSMAMRVAAMPERVSIRLVILGLPNNLRLVFALFGAMVGDAVVRVHIGDEGCRNRPARGAPACRAW